MGAWQFAKRPSNIRAPGRYGEEQSIRTRTGCIQAHERASRTRRCTGALSKLGCHAAFRLIEEDNEPTIAYSGTTTTQGKLPACSLCPDRATDSPLVSALRPKADPDSQFVGHDPVLSPTPADTFGSEEEPALTRTLALCA
jgi:hypothetical protein